MSKIEKKQLNFILINSVIFIGSIIILLLSYIGYKILFPTKIVKDLPKNTDLFVEFELKSMNKFEESLGKNLPWFFSYGDKITKINKGAVIYYKGEKIDVLLTGSKRNSIKILKTLTNNKKSITQSGNIILSLESPIPPCVQKGNSLFCGKKIKTLKDLLKNESKIRENKKFLKIENNLYKNPIFFGFINLQNNEKMQLTKEKFDSMGISIRENNGNIEGIIFGNYNKEYNHLKLEKKRVLNLEKYVNTENTIASFGAREFEKQVGNLLENNEKNPSYLGLLGKGIIQGKLKEVFGESVKLEDFLKVFSGEAVFSIFKENGKYEFEIIAEKTDLNKGMLKEYEKNLDRFLPFKEVFQYKDIELTQISTNDKNIEKTEEFFNGAKIYGFKAKEQDFGIYFTENKKIIKISSNKEYIKRNLSAKTRNLLDKLPKMPYSNDFGYINTKNLNKMTEEFNMKEVLIIPKILKNKTISWASLSFDDGMQVKFDIEDWKIVKKVILLETGSVKTSSGEILGEKKENEK